MALSMGYYDAVTGAAVVPRHLARGDSTIVSLLAALLVALARFFCGASYSL